MKAQIDPTLEDTRLDALFALDILDTPQEERFDRLTRLAKSVFGVPMAWISLLDEHREWIKSGDGLNGREVTRDNSFCAHVIRGQRVLVVPDAKRDPRFRDNPLVTGQPHIRFYAACPLHAPNGATVGAFSVLDHVAHRDSARGRALLRDLSLMAERELASVHLATIDEVTMLSNRRGFEALSAHALELTRRFKQPATMLSIALERLDDIRKQYGDAEVAHVLRAFTHLLQKTFRDCDVLARIDGGEFAAFLPTVSTSAIENTLRRLQHSVEDYNRSGKRDYDIRFNTGKVGFDASGHADVAELMAVANAMALSQSVRP